MMLLSKERVLIASVDQSESEKSLGDGVTEVFSCEKIWPYHKISIVRMEFGLRIHSKDLQEQRLLKCE